MKKSVKTLVLITNFLFVFLPAGAQPILPVRSAVATDIKKVIGDYPQGFIHHMGGIIEEHPQSTDYPCGIS